MKVLGSVAPPAGQTGRQVRPTEERPKKAAVKQTCTLSPGAGLQSQDSVPQCRPNLPGPILPALEEHPAAQSGGLTDARLSPYAEGSRNSPLLYTRHTPSPSPTAQSRQGPARTSAFHHPPAAAGSNHGWRINHPEISRSPVPLVLPQPRAKLPPYSTH